MARTALAEWTGDWVLKQIRDNKHVREATLVQPQLLHILRNDLPDIVVATVAVERLDAAALAPVLDSDPRPDFVVNVPKESYTKGSALELADSRGVSIGGMGDFVRALEIADVSTHMNKEVDFIQRGLRQHSMVTDLERLDDRRFRIRRIAHADVTAVFLPEYELTADHVRTARERYGDFTDLVISNPNGRVTAAASAAAATMGVEIHKWGPFLGRLNRP
jgi:hypothetical protein